MRKIARILFIFAGAIFPIFIGTLHTIVHFSDLVSPEVKQTLQQEILIMGEAKIMWHTWGITSFMMGLSFIVIGLLNISLIRSLSKLVALPILAILAMMIYLFGVIYVGYEFEQSFQFYGGIFGLLVMLFCLVLTIKDSENKLT